MDEFRVNWQLIVLTVVSGQALLFALVLLFQKGGNRKANICLALLVVLLIWHHADFIVIASFWYQVFPWLYTPHYVSWFLFGPLLYLYIRFVLDPGYKPGAGYFLAFLPALISFANYFGLYAMDKNSKVQMIKASVIENISDPVQYFVPFIPRDVIFVGQLVFLAVFLWLCFGYLRQAGNKPAFQKQGHDALTRRWLNFVMISFTLTVLISNFYFQAIWIFPLLNIGPSIYLYIAPLTVLLLLLEFKAFLIPEVYASQFPDNKKEKKYRNSKLSEQQEQAIISQLKNFMLQHEPYLDEGLRISSLSRQLDIPVNHLSQAINSQLQQNFFEFVNSYRVDAARRIIDRSDLSDLNLLDIAMESGFNNKTTFLNAFKKCLDMSPSAYKKSLQRQYLTEK